MQFPVKNTKGEVVGQMELSDQVYGAPLNADLLHQVMVHHQGNQRQGTSSTKTRGEVSGGGRKPFAQKHTGRARMGSTRSPLARHGGVTFGPRPRSYRTSLPKKMRRQAIRCVLSAKVAQSRVVVLENMDFAAGKTNCFIGDDDGVSGGRRGTYPPAMARCTGLVFGVAPTFATGQPGNR